MSGNSTLFLKMSEQDFMQIPDGVRQAHLADKVYQQEDNDFDELMKDEHYRKLYKAKKTASKELTNHTHFLREQRRKTINNKF